MHLSQTGIFSDAVIRRVLRRKWYLENYTHQRTICIRHFFPNQLMIKIQNERPEEWVRLRKEAEDWLREQEDSSDTLLEQRKCTMH